MSSRPRDPTCTSKATAAEQSLRLRLKPVSGSGPDRLTLLVIPPETSAADARTMSVAVGENNVDSVETLLARRGMDGGSA